MIYAYMCDIKGEIQGCNVAIMLRITNFICKQPIRCVLWVMYIGLKKPDLH